MPSYGSEEELCGLRGIAKIENCGDREYRYITKD